MNIRYYAPYNIDTHYDVKSGFSWTLLLFSTIFGLPFWFRRMYAYGLGMSLLNLLCMVFYNSNQEAYGIICLIQIVLCVFFAIKGNEITRNYLESQGWKKETQDQTIARNLG